MELNATEFLNTDPLPQQLLSLHTKKKHPSLCCNCPIKIFPLEDVSHYRPPGSLWSCLQPIIWTSMSGKPLRPRGARRQTGESVLSSSHPLLLGREAKQKTDLWPLSQGNSTQCRFRVRWQGVWPFTTEIMTCSCARGSEGYRGERDTSGDVWQFLEGGWRGGGKLALNTLIGPRK